MSEVAGKIQCLTEELARQGVSRNSIASALRLMAVELLGNRKRSQKKREAKARRTLADRYIKTLLYNNGIERRFITNDLIEIKRLAIMAERAVKSSTNNEKPV